MLGLACPPVGHVRSSSRSGRKCCTAVEGESVPKAVVSTCTKIAARCRPLPSAQKRASSGMSPRRTLHGSPRGRAKPTGSCPRRNESSGLSKLHIEPCGSLEVVDWIALYNWYAELNRYGEILGQAPPHAEIE